MRLHSLHMHLLTTLTNRKRFCNAQLYVSRKVHQSYLTINGMMVQNFAACCWMNSRHLYFDQLALVFMNFLCQLYETICKMKSHCLPVKSRILAPGCILNTNYANIHFTILSLLFEQSMPLPQKSSYNQVLRSSDHMTKWACSKNSL